MVINNLLNASMWSKYYTGQILAVLYNTQFFRIWECRNIKLDKFVKNKFYFVKGFSTYSRTDKSSMIP